MPVLLPTNSPAPMIPPIEIIVTWRERKSRLSRALGDADACVASALEDTVRSRERLLRAAHVRVAHQHDEVDEPALAERVARGGERGVGDEARIKQFGREARFHALALFTPPAATRVTRRTIPLAH